jgi:alanine-alpha-ketoisovalerate/valine-pyruvate aminotransferase
LCVCNNYVNSILALCVKYLDIGVIEYLLLVLDLAYAMPVLLIVIFKESKLYWKWNVFLIFKLA